MAVHDNFHSKLVLWTKIMLPLAALGLLSTLFLLARDPGQPTEISFSEIVALARDQQITAPRFSGVTDDGSVLQITASSARPDLTRSDVINLDRIAMRVDHSDGSTINVTSITGLIEGRKRIAQFGGLARIETSSGYEMETSGLTAELDTGLITSDGQLEIQAPFGMLTAGQVVFRVSVDNVGQQMHFTQGVRLVYQPQS